MPSPLSPPLPAPSGARRPAPDQRVYWRGLNGSATALAISQLAAQREQPVLWITRDSNAARQVEQELSFYAPELPVLHFPDWETLPYDSFSPHQDIVSERLTTLYQLPQTRRGVLVVPVATLMHRLAPPAYLQRNSLVIDRGQRLDLTAMRERLAESGYRAVNTVYEHGEFALRGAILDLFPMGSRHPFRIDLMDDEVDTLRTFDPETQRTLEQVDSIRLLPGREYPLDDAAVRAFRDRWHAAFDVDHRRCPVYQDISAGIASAGAEYFLPLFFGDCASLFDYLPELALVITEPGLEQAAEHFWQEVQRRYRDYGGNLERPLLPPAQVFTPVEGLFRQLGGYQRLLPFGGNDPDTRAQGEDLGTLQPPELSIDARAGDPLAALRSFIEGGLKVLLVAESAGRRESLLELLRQHQLPIDSIDGWQAFLNDDIQRAITVAPLERGLVSPADGVAVVTEAQLFGQRVMQSRRRRRSDERVDNAVRNLSELRIGAPVVHIDHGVGRYQGLQHLDVDGQAMEFLTLEYAEGAKLYVPVISLHLISRYTGAEEDHAPLHRLGSDQWQKARRKAAEKVRDVAAELLDIYARRAARSGRAFELDQQAHAAFAAGFPFEETPDQQAAIDAVLADMTAARTMDRLVCGDVGFGKTEVAMRAAFTAVQNNTQVAMLVPTTLLAQQHYTSFRDRFADWPVRIEVLSRFRSSAEQEQVLADVAAGKVDILIGTHKLLQPSVKYRDLGLLIIDEEHRFGVRQKDQLKALRAEVDILTLTATPIPRTLNLSLSGLRDLSIIATPPARRLSVKTFVRERDPGLIKEAILREILRGGQVYYLHNDVKSIERMARELTELLPEELRIGVGHGQIRERELEQVMSDFYHRRYNVLLCSTIIETGIDVPNANTIIIERADKFGLAQLHQLRGRVGRSHHQAYAYLLTPDRRQLTADAVKRLEAISEADDLGSGFNLARHDLEIRGAGELLGDEQSGQIESIGFTLYSEMLERAVESLRSGHIPDADADLQAQVAEINLRLPALIPDDYLPDVHTRLILYKRIANAVSDDALRELQVEMIDRFGLLPEPLQNLFRITALKLRAEHLGIRKIEASAGSGRLEFNERTRVEPIQLVKLVQTQPDQYRLTGATTLGFTLPMAEPGQRFAEVEALLHRLAPQGHNQCAA